MRNRKNNRVVSPVNGAYPVLWVFEEREAWRLSGTNSMPSYRTLSEKEAIGPVSTARRNTATTVGKGFIAPTYGHVEIYRPDGTRITFSRIATDVISGLEAILSPLGTGRIQFSEKHVSANSPCERTSHTSTPKRRERTSTNTTKRNSRGYKNSGKKDTRTTSTLSPGTDVPRVAKPNNAVELFDQLDGVPPMVQMVRRGK